MKIENIYKSYGNLQIIKDFSMEVKDGEIVALIGPSGCGKSTLMNIIAGLEKADKGKISADSQKIGYIFQESRLLPWRTVFENIHLVRKSGSREEVMKWIDAVGLHGFENYYPDQLSGGMAKRCAIARAFYYRSDLLLLDEPFQGIDYGIRMEMLEMLLEIWREEKHGVLFVTHEIDEALTVASRILILSSRPASVIDEIILPGREGRDASSEELQSIRHRIIQHILSQKSEKKEVPVCRR